MEIKRSTLVEAVEAAIEVSPRITPPLAADLREVAATTRAVGDNFNTTPPCIAGQVFQWPFHDHGATYDEHRALVSFGSTFDTELRRRWSVVGGVEIVDD